MPRPVPPPLRDEAVAIVSGFLTEGETPAIPEILLPGSTRSVITETKLRITHGSPSTPAVDLYLVADETDINGVYPNFANVPFGADTTQRGLVMIRRSDPGARQFHDFGASKRVRPRAVTIRSHGQAFSRRT